MGIRSHRADGSSASPSSTWAPIAGVLVRLGGIPGVEDGGMRGEDGDGICSEDGAGVLNEGELVMKSDVPGVAW